MCSQRLLKCPQGESAPDHGVSISIPCLNGNCLSRTSCRVEGIYYLRRSLPMSDYYSSLSPLLHIYPHPFPHSPPPPPSCPPSPLLLFSPSPSLQQEMAKRKRSFDDFFNFCNFVLAYEEKLVSRSYMAMSPFT